MKVKFTILGEPCGKGRPRFSKVRGPYTPEKTVNAENLVKIEYRRQCNDFQYGKETPLDMRITAYYSIPKNTSKKKIELMERHVIRPTKKPDNDNVIKLIQDALNKVAYYDDTQIVDCQLRKFYSENARVTVTIQEAT